MPPETATVLLSGPAHSDLDLWVEAAEPEGLLAALVVLCDRFGPRA